MRNETHLTKIIQRAIHMIDDELASKLLSKSGTRSTKQLEQFRCALTAMLDSLDGGSTIDNVLADGMGRIIIDSWPLDSPLGEAILEAVQEYHKFGERFQASSMTPPSSPPSQSN